MYTVIEIGETNESLQASISIAFLLSMELHRSGGMLEERERKRISEISLNEFSLLGVNLFPSPLWKLIHASDGVTLPLTSSGALMLACCSSSMLEFSF